MNELIAALRQFLQGLRLWITVTPWEQAIRVRMGKHVKLLGPGVHTKIPFLDLIYLQSTRMRISDLPRQTLTTQDGKSITLAGQLGYEISNLQKLYCTLHHAEDTITGLSRAEIATFVSDHKMEECTQTNIECVIEKLDLSRYGLSNVELRIIDFAVVRTYRLIGDYACGTWGSKLSTDTLHSRTEAK
jgi:regulator of protease activity HflC (stomatin/prohibitin superfamily)